jgi:hypothetical protein
MMRHRSTNPECGYEQTIAARQTDGTERGSPQSQLDARWKDTFGFRQLRGVRCHKDFP